MLFLIIAALLIVLPLLMALLMREGAIAPVPTPIPVRIAQGATYRYCTGPVRRRPIR
jgi:hypothetical protein